MAPAVQVQPVPAMGLDLRSSAQISPGFGVLGLVHGRTWWVCVQAPFCKLRDVGQVGVKEAGAPFNCLDNHC